MSEVNPLLAAALSYARRGWPVFPAHTPTQGGCSCNREGCGNVGKHPRTMHGLKDAVTDEKTILRWWEIWPDANVALVTGAVSGLLALDIDPRHGGEENVHYLEAKHCALPQTVAALTGGGGFHKLFIHPGQRVKCRSGKNALLPGVEVKADGGYLIVEPSLHQHGRTYRWEIGFAPDEIPLAAPPAWLLQLMLEQRTRADGQQGVGIDSRIAEGSRNVTLTSFAGSMRRRGFSTEAILAALLVENAQRCDPPLEDEEVRRIAASIGRYAPGNSFHRHGSAIEGGVLGDVRGLLVQRITGPIPRPRSLVVGGRTRWPS